MPVSFRPTHPHRPGHGLARLLLLLFCLVAWAMAPGAEARKSKENASLPSIVQQALSLVPSDRSEAIQVLEDYLNGGSRDPELIPWVLLHAGEQRRLSNDPTRARAHFQRLRDSYPDHVLVRGAVLGISLVDGGENPAGNTLATLGMYREEPALPASMEADRYRLLALVSQRAGADAAETSALAALSMEFAEQSGDAVVLSRCIRTVAPLKVALVTRTEVAGTSGDGGDLDRAQAALLADDFDDARRIAESFLATWPESPRAQEARYVIQRAEKGDRVDVRKVGVLLPLSGTYAPPAARQKQAIEAAVERYGQGIQIVFRDTTGDPEKALAALEELVLTDGVVAVLGPLLKEEADLLAPAAQALRVPMVTFSQKPGITLDRDYVFRGFVTADQQVQALLDYVMGRMSLTSFAIVAPDNPYGHMAAEAFTAAVTARQGTILASRFYDPSKGDFREDARALADVDAKARAGELYRLRKQAEAKGMDPDKVVLPPVVQFQGIFIPDGYHRVALVSSALAWQEFSLGRFKPRRNDVPLVVMGLNGWHDDRLCTEGGAYVQDGLLVDAFDPEDSEAGVQDFVGLFRERVGSAPGVVEAMTWDSARFVFAAAQAGVTDRPSMREALTRVVLPDPVTGGGSFDKDREVARELRVLKVGKTAIEPAGDPLPPEEVVP